MNKIRPFVYVTCLLLLSCSGGEPETPPTPAPPPLAISGTMSLSVEEFSSRQAADPLTPPLRIVEDWAREATLLAEVYRRGIDQRPEVIERRRRAVRLVLLAELERELTGEVDPPGSRAVKRWWDRQFHSFRVGEPMMRADLYSHSNGDTLSRIRKLLQGEVSENWIRDHFPVVRIHDTGFLFRAELRRELAAFLFDSTATISGVIPIGEHYFLLKRTGERDPDHHFTLTEVEDEIGTYLLQQERERRLSTWRAQRLQELELEVDTLRVIAAAESLLTGAPQPLPDAVASP